jgi:hypothetical protein
MGPGATPSEAFSPILLFCIFMPSYLSGVAAGGSPTRKRIQNDYPIKSHPPHRIILHCHQKDPDKKKARLPAPSTA